jgi:hypothetical protein
VLRQTKANGTENGKPLINGLPTLNQS